TLAEKQAIRHWLHAKLGAALDDSLGSCFMRDRRIARIVADAICHFDEERYLLYAWCVMPNHVHVVLSISEGVHLDQVMHSWKSFTSNSANRVLGRRGSFWQDDYFDRSLRDGRELQETVAYVLNNPRAMGDWPFVAAYGERLAHFTADVAGREVRRR
ncbi:MAG TPA: transposase, partial [Thermoanaerobaculia bacterium]